MGVGDGALSCPCYMILVMETLLAVLSVHGGEERVESALSFEEESGRAWCAVVLLEVVPLVASVLRCVSRTDTSKPKARSHRAVPCVLSGEPYVICFG